MNANERFGTLPAKDSSFDTKKQAKAVSKKNGKKWQS
jgi:hypothetical protein